MRSYTNKKFHRFYDPRVWVRAGEVTMSKRVAEALADFNCVNQLA